jgi:hypothetical protein
MLIHELEDLSLPSPDNMRMWLIDREAFSPQHVELALFEELLVALVVGVKFCLFELSLKPI